MKFYKQVNNEGQSQENELPDKEAVTKFCSEIWGEDKEHNRNTEWFEEMKGKTKDIPQQEKVVITGNRMKNILNKMPNWKAPGPDGMQNFRSIHENL